MSDGPVIDSGLAREVLEQIAQEPDSWDQDWWMSRPVGAQDGCGTACCVAGWAVRLGRPDLRVREWWPSSRKLSRENVSSMLLMQDGETIHFQYAAGDALGLTSWEGAWLFNASRTRTEVLAALALLQNGQRIGILMAL